MRALVVTTVHQADDPRIRERTIGALGAAFEVSYAAKTPPPSRTDDIDWIPLVGGRTRRWWKALRLMAGRRFAVVSVHDPELIPAALVARLLGRQIVFDVHEDVPTQVRHKMWIPAPLRPLLAWFSRLLLRVASRVLVVTLAEPGYRRLFRRDHPVFPNLARAGSLPPLAGDAGYLVYVGDVTITRGAETMLETAALMEPRRPLTIVGRCPIDLAGRLTLQAETAGVDLTLTGPLPHGEAMRQAAGASVGLSLLHGAPNERDSMPTKVIEYLQMGVPVVASDLPGTRDAVAGLHGVVLVEPGDPAAACGGIIRALEMDRQVLAAQATRLREERVWPDVEVVDLYVRMASRMSGTRQPPAEG